MRFSFIPCTAPCAAVGLLSDTRPIQHRTLNPQRWSCEIVALCMLCGNMGLALHQGGHGSARNHNNTTPHSRHGDNGGGWQQTRSACARTHTHTHTHTHANVHTTLMDLLCTSCAWRVCPPCGLAGTPTPSMLFLAVLAFPWQELKLPGHG
jgi:hypothetical protein